MFLMVSFNIFILVFIIWRLDWEFFGFIYLIDGGGFLVVVYFRVIVLLVVVEIGLEGVVMILGLFESEKCGCW